MTTLRRKELLSLIVVVLFAVPCISAQAAQWLDKSKSTNKYSEDEKTLRTQAEDYAKAFTSGNAAALAKMWTPDGSFTDTEGRQHKGRVAIQALFESYFKQFGGQPLKVSVESIRFPASGIAIEEGTSCLLKAPAQPITLPCLSRYTVFHVKENGQWQMAAALETRCAATSNNVSLKDLSWLVGNWTVKDASPNSIRFKADWTANGNFIHCSYETGSAEQRQIQETEIIGYNPLSKQLTSWHFDANGGFGMCRWLKDGQSWVISAKSVEPNGTTGSARYTLRKLDGSSFTWHSTQRRLAGRDLPNTQEIMVIKEETKKRILGDKGEGIVDHD